MKLAAPLAVLVAVGACGSPPSPAAPRNAPTVADPDDALVGTWVLHYELTSITEDYSPDSPEADAEGVVRTRPPAVARWQVVHARWPTAR